jgi:Dolichyl-phosphate-mannose-protein mannosyltransferase
VRRPTFEKKASGRRFLVDAGEIMLGARVAVRDWQELSRPSTPRLVLLPSKATVGFFARHREAISIFGLALALRLLFSMLMSGTYDGDEFVYIALGRDVAHGAIPYRDFAFFHPPGILVISGILDPLTSLWWPLARLVDVLIDCGTALLVWRVGSELFGRRAGMAAAILYAISPVVLVSAVRVDQEAPMTALGMLGIWLLVTRRSRKAAVLAGACLAAALWVKYPMLFFLPAYLLLARRRALYCLAGFIAVAALLFLPYLGEARQLYNDTVVWQMVSRYHAAFDTRLEVTLIFWLALNPFAVAAIFRSPRPPIWLVAAFATGCIFLVTSSTYSHYFVPIQPFAALLAAPLVSRLVRVSSRAVASICVALMAVWAMAIVAPGFRTYFIASQFSDVKPMLQFVGRITAPGTPLLVNRFEYALLAQRPWQAHYFWDVSSVVTAKELERRIAKGSAVILSSYTHWSPYPHGFVAYLNAHYPRFMVDEKAVWLVRPLRHGPEKARSAL